MKQILILLGLLLLSSNLSLAQADCSETPPDGMEPLAALSLFNDNYRNGDYEFALKYGRWMHCAKPKKLEGYPRFSLESQYERLVKVYGEISELKSDPAIKSAYIDTALTLLDESMEMFGTDDESRFEIHLNTGRFYQAHYNLIDDGLSKAYRHYEEMFKINPERAVQLGNGYYLRLALTNMVNKERKEDAQALIDTVRPLVKGELLTFVEEQQRELLGNPEEQVAYFEPIVKEEPDNLEAWKVLENAYEEMGNREKLAEARTKIHEIEPSYESAFSLAQLAQSNSDYDEAAKYFKEAITYVDNEDDKKSLLLELADAQLNQGQLELAKSTVDKALKIDPDYGMAYIKISSIYAQAVTQCTQDGKLDPKDKVVYWAVVDYLKKAKQVDPSVSNIVNRQLSTYEAVTPTTSESFLSLNLEPGDKITIDGKLKSCYSWINETVTVR